MRFIKFVLFILFVTVFVRAENTSPPAFVKVEGQRVVSAGLIRRFAPRQVKALYGKPSPREERSIAPNPSDLARYQNFLNTPGTGLIKLINDKGCSENEKIVIATAECLKYEFPGAGSSYSFRKKNYRLGRLADLTFTDNSFQATGNVLHGIFVNIGDIPLEKVNLKTKGLDFLQKFKPSETYQEAKRVDGILSRGVFINGFLYRRALFARENTTFVLRSIAYRGKSFKAIRGLVYNELDFDKRRDIIIAFRIVRKSGDESVSLLWKEIADKKSPKLKR